MRITLRQLQVFVAVADAGTTTAAGLSLGLSQSATSGALNELEGLLGARFFDRIGKRLLLNDNGRALLSNARALLDAAAGIERQFSLALSPSTDAAIATQLRLGASTTIGNYLLPTLVASYRRAWPRTGISVQIGNTQDVTAAVARFDVDMGLIEGPCHEAELLARPWLEDELVVVCAPGHALVRSIGTGRAGLKVLRQSQWLLREPGSGTREAVEQALLPHLHQLPSEMQFGSTEAIKQAAAEGLGLTCLSLSVVQDLLTLRRLAIVNTTLPRLTRRFYLIHHRAKQFSQSLRRFEEHCMAALS